MKRRGTAWLDAAPLAARFVWFAAMIAEQTGRFTMSPREKLELVRKLNRGLIGLSVAGVRSRHPSIEPRELALRVAALRLPREIMVRVFDWDPEREGY